MTRMMVAILKFYAALARQCFINEYVFFHDAEEIRRAARQRDDLAASLEAGTPVLSLQLLAVAAYFPLYSLCGAARRLERSWPEDVMAVLGQQVREPQEEAQLRAATPRLTPIADATSRLVQDQYEENPYPQGWVPHAAGREGEQHHRLFASEISFCRLRASKSGMALRWRNFSAPAVAPARLLLNSHKM